VPDANGLIPANEVTIGGRRVGVVDSVEAMLGERGRPYARLNLKLDAELQGKVRSDAIVRIRPASLFELKYVQLEPGSRGEPLSEGDVIPISQSRANVNLADAFSFLDAPTRSSLQRVLTGAGQGLAGRGADLNAALGDLAPLLADLRPVLSDLADPATGLGRMIRSLAAVNGELASVAPELAMLLRDAEITLTALEAAGPELEQTLEELPPTIATSTPALAELRAPLREARHLTSTLRRAAPLLAPVSRRLTSTLQAGIPALDVVPPVAAELHPALRSLRALAARAPLAASVLLLGEALPQLDTGVRFIAPYQLVCNYGGLAARNLASTFSEGTASGNWLRFIPVFALEEGQQSAAPAPDLHYNPYPNGAAPGQPLECEAGNEVYLPGRQIGNIPGDQGTRTEATGPDG
jgi:virulence factor Mce-like protein